MSLVRQLADADFCSDDHRRRYQELTRLALDRLLDAGQRLGTPEVHLDEEAVPAWQPEPIAVDTAYDETIAPPAPVFEPTRYAEPERSPWRPAPPEPEPAFAEPPPEDGVPPEAYYFARLECAPQPVDFEPQTANIDGFEGSFNAPRSAVPKDRCGMRQSLFVREPFLRAMKRPLPAHSGAAGEFYGFHGAVRCESNTLPLELAAAVHEPAERPLADTRPRPATMPAAVHTASGSAGRAVPRPALPRVHVSGGLRAGFELAGMAAYPLVRGAAVAASAARALAPAVAFGSALSFSHQSTIRSRASVLRGSFANVPRPHATKRAAHWLEEPELEYAWTILLPGIQSRPAAEGEISAPPPLAPEWPAQKPRARAFPAAMLSAPIAPYAVAQVVLPQLADTAQMSAVIETGFAKLGYGAAIAPRQHTPTLNFDLATAFAAAATPITPQSASPAAMYARLDPATFAATSASVPAGRSLPGIRTLGAQYGRPEALVQIPELAGGVSVACLPEGGPRLGLMPRRPVSVAFAAHPAITIEFQSEPVTPACHIRFLAAIEGASTFPTPYPSARIGFRSAASVSLDFEERLPSPPELSAPAALSQLASIEPGTHQPAALAGRISGAMILGALVIEGTSEVRLPDVALKTSILAGAIEPQPLQQIERPLVAGRPAVARVLSECRTECPTLLPAAPDPAGAAHLIPVGIEHPLPPRQVASQPSSTRTVECPLSLPPAALVKWSARTATPLALGASPAIRSQIGGTAIHSTAQPCGWLTLLPAAPAIEGDSTPLRSGLPSVGALSSASIGRGTYLDRAPRPPAVGTAAGAVSPFAAQETSLPAERTIVAREALDGAAAITVPPRPRAGHAAAILVAGTGFRQRNCLLPEIRLDATLSRIASARSLDECPTLPLPSPARHEASKPAAAQMVVVPIPFSTPLDMAAGRIRPVGPFALGTGGIELWSNQKACPIASRRREAELVPFELSAPIQPVSAGVRARSTLAFTPPAARKGQPQSGASKPTAVSVVASSTQPVELAGAQALAFEHPLPPSTFSAVRGRAVNRAAAGVPAGWEPYGRESSTVEHASIQSPWTGARWPDVTSSRFAHEREYPAKAGSATKADPRVFTEFAAPAARCPELATYGLALGSAPVTKIAAPALRQDAVTAQKTVHLEPMVRPHRHPSRLPVFHTTVDKAHMPSGEFLIVEREDVNDERTLKSGASYPAPQIEPWIPSLAFAPHGRESLPDAPLGAVEPAPHTGAGAPDGLCGELQFAFELAVLGSGAQLEKLDFEAIAETYSPRWRSALKSASGLFRSVVVVLFVIALGTANIACSSRGKSMKETIQSRAVITMEYDFSKGLDGWYGEDGWAGNWLHNPAGFVEAGQLALYRPSRPLSDYQFEFLSEISGGSVGWVFRAADLQNYYATELSTVKPGPLPELELVRYQVIGGQESEHVKVSLHLGYRNGVPLRIQEVVAGNGFTTSVDGAVVDAWTDDRLRTGGVGFLGRPKDRSNIYWMRVSNNDDFWGKVCAMIAPNN